MYTFRKAQPDDLPQLWEIFQYAIARRKEDGSNQWQDGYPNPEVLRNDIGAGTGFVLAEGETIAGYCAIMINDEPAYATIEGEWLTEGDFVVFHRVAVSKDHLGKGLAKQLMKHIEAFALKKNIYSIKADTNYDNSAMLRIFESMGYVYCGEVYFRGSPRKAYEKSILPSAQ
ncbi:GNAT family N-acetyltransferase [Parapedobacter sp. 10938]|uniref:GNAT family N-acetyltransferase n=1 Tax=Parapedobacter flavus TaxID=3110225 RepID=UPI002DBE3187|nr:GNAT family N-acetyltransferase [Parapedobacter sp. 10938]MEC3878059.1 GNAT family N-acetyltransferase [Parapedobacter sp. 10938]